MSRDRGSINFILEEEIQPDEWMNLLSDLNQKGWKYRSPISGCVNIIPLNSDSINWSKTDLSDNEIKQVIVEKQKIKEPIGIAINLFENNTNHSIDDLILYQEEKTISIWLGDRATEIKKHLIIDYSHYLPIFLPIMHKLRKCFELSISAYVDRV